MSPWDPRNSDAALRRDIERWSKEATEAEAAGHPIIADFIRTQWIHPVQQLIGRDLAPHHA